MDIRIILTLTFLWSITIVNCRNSCASTSKRLTYIRGFYQQNVDLLCNITRNCSRVFWKRNGKEVETEDDPQQCTNCDYRVSNNEINSTYILRINNLSENAKGLYFCHCQSRIPNSNIITASTEGCYNLTLHTLHCGMKTRIKGKETIQYDGNHLVNTIETIEANINDVLSVTCLDDQQKKTNCSELEHPWYDIPLRTSDTWCHFSCTITEGTATCEVSIILNVTAGLQSPSITLMNTYSTPTISSLHSTPNLSTVNNQNITTSKESSNEFYTIKPSTVHTYRAADQSTSKQSKKIMQHFTTGILVTSEEHSTEYTKLSNTLYQRAADQSTNKQSKTIMQHFTTGMLVKTSKEYSTEDTKLNNTLSQSIFQDKIMLSFLVALIFMSTITTLLSVYIVIIKKPCYVVSSQKEKWINPLYDSSVNDRATPYAETDISGVRLYGMTRHDQSLPCLDVVSIQEGTQFHSLGSLNITENKEPSWFTENYKHEKAGNERFDGLVSHLNANLDTKLGRRSNLNETISDIESDSFSSDEDEEPHPIIRLKERKQRFYSLHIYEDANIGGTS